MSEKRIDVPYEMLQAAMKAISESVLCGTQNHALEAALEWHRQNPVAPTKAQKDRLHAVLLEGLQYWFPGTPDLKRSAAQSLLGQVLDWEQATQKSLFELRDDVPDIVEALHWKPSGSFISDEQLKACEAECRRHNDAINQAYRLGLEAAKEKQ